MIKKGIRRSKIIGTIIFFMGIFIISLILLNNFLHPKPSNNIKEDVCPKETNYSYNEINEISSGTSIQPSKYFSDFNYTFYDENSVRFKDSDSPIKIDNKNRQIMITNFNNKDIFYTLIRDTGSMRPSIPDGAIVFLIKPNISEINIGDIIMVRDTWNNGLSEKHLLHRVLDIKNDTFLTKGDNNVNFDRYWAFSEVEYKVVGEIW